MSDLNNVVIVGASLAGLRAGETLRTDGFTGRIVMIGAEAHRPYDRPPLSKKVLAGEWEAERITLRKPEDLDSLGFEWRTGTTATGVDLVTRTVRVDGGDDVAFDGLILATGAAARRLPGQPEWHGIHVLRTLEDSLSLRTELREGAKVVVIGAGFIGLEVAATARARQCDVTVLEGALAPMMRGLGAEMGHAAALVHGDHGVDLRLGVSVAGLHEGAVGRVGSVELSSGERIPADVVVVGVGAAPATRWLDDSGLIVRDGVVCDEFLNVGVPRIYAAGDVCRWMNPLYDEEMRVEHWTTASEQGAAAARNLMAEAHGTERSAYAAVPFFWSDQFSARIQFLGRAHDDDRARIVLGSPEERSFLTLYERGGILVAALGVNRPRQLMPLRALIARRATVGEADELIASLTAA